MWITQHFVPWPWRTKGGEGGVGDASGAERDAPGGEHPESTPACFAWCHCPPPTPPLVRGGEVPPGHPGTACHMDRHRFSTKMAACQMKPSGAGIKMFRLLHCWDSWATWMKIRVRQIAMEAPDKFPDKSVEGGVDEYLSILSEDANI